MILAIMHSYIHEQAMMDITPNSSSVIIAGDKCILFLVLVVTVNLLHSRPRKALKSERSSSDKHGELRARADNFTAGQNLSAQRNQGERAEYAVSGQHTFSTLLGLVCWAQSYRPNWSHGRLLNNKASLTRLESLQSPPVGYCILTRLLIQV